MPKSHSVELPSGEYFVGSIDYLIHHNGLQRKREQTLLLNSRYDTLRPFDFVNGRYRAVALKFERPHIQGETHSRVVLKTNRSNTDIAFVEPDTYGTPATDRLLVIYDIRQLGDNFPLADPTDQYHFELSHEPSTIAYDGRTLSVGDWEIYVHDKLPRPSTGGDAPSFPKGY